MDFIKGKRNLELLNFCMGIIDNTMALAIYLKKSILLSTGNDIKILTAIKSASYIDKKRVNKKQSLK